MKINIMVTNESHELLDRIEVEYERGGKKSGFRELRIIQYNHKTGETEHLGDLQP